MQIVFTQSNAPSQVLASHFFRSQRFIHPCSASYAAMLNTFTQDDSKYQRFHILSRHKLIQSFIFETLSLSWICSITSVNSGNALKDLPLANHADIIQPKAAALQYGGLDKEFLYV